MQALSSIAFIWQCKWSYKLSYKWAHHLHLVNSHHSRATKNGQRGRGLVGARSDFFGWNAYHLSRVLSSIYTLRWHDCEQKIPVTQVAMLLIMSMGLTPFWSKHPVASQWIAVWVTSVLASRGRVKHCHLDKTSIDYKNISKKQVLTDVLHYLPLVSLFIYPELFRETLYTPVCGTGASHLIRSLHFHGCLPLPTDYMQ